MTQIKLQPQVKLQTKLWGQNQLSDQLLVQLHSQLINHLGCPFDNQLWYHLRNQFGSRFNEITN